MSSSSSGGGELPPNWETATDGLGRTYYWNVDTDEVSWEKPTVVQATSVISERYVSQLPGSKTNTTSPAAADLDILRVAKLAQQFDKNEASRPREHTAKGIDIAAEYQGKSKATGVDALRKYQEAKAAAASSTSPEPASARGTPPPQVDLYK